MKVLFISYDGMTDPLGQSQVLPYLVGLSKKGHRITLISCEKPNRYDGKKRDIQAITKINDIKWKPIFYTSKPAVLSTIYDVFRLKKLSKKLYKENKFDIIHCRGYISALVGLSLKKTLGVKFIFDMRGFFADERVDGGLWNLKNPIYWLVYKYFKRKEIEFFSTADHTVSLTQNGKNEIRSWTKIENQPIPIEVIPCCADLDFFSESNVNKEELWQLKNDYNIENDCIVFSYLGSIGTWYMLDEMFDFFKRVLLKHSSAKFLFITGDSKEYIQETARRIGVALSSIIIVKADREKVPLYISLSNISIFFIKPVFSKKASSPTKQGEVMSLGIPIICNAYVGDTDKIIEDTQTGYVLKRFNMIDYDKAVDKIEELMLIPKYQIKQAAEKYYSLENGINSYNTIYERIS